MKNNKLFLTVSVNQNKRNGGGKKISMCLKLIAKNLMCNGYFLFENYLCKLSPDKHYPKGKISHFTIKKPGKHHLN